MRILALLASLVLYSLSAWVMCNESPEVELSNSHSQQVNNPEIVHSAVTPMTESGNVAPQSDQTLTNKRENQNQDRPEHVQNVDMNFADKNQKDMKNERSRESNLPASDSRNNPDHSNGTPKQRPSDGSQRQKDDVLNKQIKEPPRDHRPQRGFNDDPSEHIDASNKKVQRPISPDSRGQDIRSSKSFNDPNHSDRREHSDHLNRDVRSDNAHPDHERDRYRHPNDDMPQRQQFHKETHPNEVPYEYQINRAYLYPSVGIHTSNSYQNPSGSDFAAVTTIIGRGLRHCYFYTPVTNFLIDYQVIRGGNLDVGIFVKNPLGVPVAIRNPAPEGTINIIAPEVERLRPFAICLDNRKSSYADKVVYFSIDAEFNWNNPTDLEKRAIEAFGSKTETAMSTENAAAEHLESVRNITNKVRAIRGRLHRIEFMQQHSDNLDSIDKALMEANLKRVTTGSLFQVLLMISVAAIQVGLIRALFDHKSYLHRLWSGSHFNAANARC